MTYSLETDTMYLSKIDQFIQFEKKIMPKSAATHFMRELSVLDVLSIFVSKVGMAMLKDSLDFEGCTRRLANFDTYLSTIFPKHVIRDRNANFLRAVKTYTLNSQVYAGCSTKRSIRATIRDYPYIRLMFEVSMRLRLSFSL